MKVSIVIPTYNQGQYIRDCLDSIRKQTYHNLEVIIQDSDSHDDTQIICNEFCRLDPRFTYFREKDSGQSDAINRGLKRSNGEIWTWICSDDYYSETNAIGVLVNGFQSARIKDAAFIGVYGDAQYVSETGGLLGPYHQQHGPLFQKDFKLDWPLSQPSSFLLTENVKKVGGVDVALHLGMDLDLFLKLLTQDRKLHYVEQLVASVRVQSNSKSVLYRKKTATTALNILQKHFGGIGNPFKSAYVREFSAAQKLEWKETFKDQMVKLFPKLEAKISAYRQYNAAISAEIKAAGTSGKHSSTSYRIARQLFRIFKTCIPIIGWPFYLGVEFYLRAKYLTWSVSNTKTEISQKSKSYL